jgi:hypothetical protein
MDIFQYPWDPPSAPVTLPGVSDAPPTRPKPRGRRKAALSHRAGQGAGAFWLFHQLTIYGPAETAVAFAAAARGSGVIPWRLAGADLEDTVFNLAVSQPARDRKLTVEGCRILARQFRDRVESHQARATETPCVNVSGIWRVACRHVWHQGRFAPAKSPVAFGDP